MGYFKSLERFFGKRTPAATGITIILLQRRMESFSTERLQAAMESGWRRKHHPVSFFATNLDDDEIGLKILELRAMPASLALISKRASAANHSSGAG
jgi:hypothetical protein